MHILWTYFRWMAKDQGYFLGGSDVSILTYFSFLKHKTREDIVDLSACKNLLLKNSWSFISLFKSKVSLSFNLIAIHQRLISNIIIWKSFGFMLMEHNFFHIFASIPSVNLLHPQQYLLFFSFLSDLFYSILGSLRRYLNDNKTSIRKTSFNTNSRGLKLCNYSCNECLVWCSFILF